MHQVYLGLGTNQGVLKENLATARNKIEESMGVIIKQSSEQVTEPWGIDDEQDFYLNQVVLIETDLEPELTFRMAKLIEEEMGREKREKWAPRVIDIDILFFDDIIFDSEELSIPHPMAHMRRFVLEEMIEIAPNFIHPTMMLSMAECLEELNNEDFSF